MPPAACIAPPQGDRIPAKPMMQQPQSPPAAAAMTPASESFAKDAIIAWFRGEFAAANAIIDALCGHLTSGGASAAEYESAFAAIHRRRMNWIPILQMQKYYSIADVTIELKKVAEKKREPEKEIEHAIDEEAKNLDRPIDESVICGDENDGGEVVNEDSSKDDSPESEITDTGSQEVQHLTENVSLCSNHEECEARRANIKMTKGFIAKEPVKGHMVNVVRGLKLYEDIFTDVELSKLNDFVSELRVAGQNGELSGDTFILYNQQVKGNKRELIQLGVPIFGQIEDGTNKFQNSYMEPIPTLLQGVIDHMIQWHLIPENRKPNSCIINFFDEGEYSQPFLKPPHLDQPVYTLLLSESSMAFGRTLVNDSEGNYRGPLMLSLKEGSLLVMRGNSSDTARHVMCASPNKRVSITLFKVRTQPKHNHLSSSSPLAPLNKAMTLWQPGLPTPYTISNGYEPTMDMNMNMMSPKWTMMRPTPVVMLAPMIVNPRRVPAGGTGVFLPWTVGSRKQGKHLPPRAQRGRFLAITSNEKSNDSGVNNNS